MMFIVSESELCPENQKNNDTWKHGSAFIMLVKGSKDHTGSFHKQEKDRTVLPQKKAQKCS